MKFCKMSGAGNDFVMIDNRDGRFDTDALVALARRACPRGSSVGADGVIALETSSAAEARMRIINSDGSEAEMCGNGARCFAVFALRLGVVKEEMTFETLAGLIHATVLPGGTSARVQLTDADVPELFAALPFADTSADVFFTNTGVPHAILAVENLEDVPINEWGAALRYHDCFEPAGTNVNFLARTPDGVAIRTYERGVEGETLACGTGTTAAALVAHLLWNLPSPIAVQTRGGDVLVIHFASQEGGFGNLLLEGPALTIYDGELPDLPGSG